MIVINDEKRYTGNGAVLALGMFDGVHLGHRALIGRAVSLARETGADSMACTFDRHPLSVLKPGSEPDALMTISARLKVFESLGADWALVKPFTYEFSRVEAHDFLADLVTATKARAIVCGENYTFGKGGAGNVALIREMAAEMGFRAEIMQSVKDNGDVVSSTLIRRLIAEGDSERAARLMGNRA